MGRAQNQISISKKLEKVVVTRLYFSPKNIQKSYLYVDSDTKDSTITADFRSQREGKNKCVQFLESLVDTEQNINVKSILVLVGS